MMTMTEPAASTQAMHNILNTKKKRSLYSTSTVSINKQTNCFLLVLSIIFPICSTVLTEYPQWKEQKDQTRKRAAQQKANGTTVLLVPAATSRRLVLHLF